MKIHHILKEGGILSAQTESLFDRTTHHDPLY